jgi:hypothetical protein
MWYKGEVQALQPIRLLEATAITEERRHDEEQTVKLIPRTSVRQNIPASIFSWPTAKYLIKNESDNIQYVVYLLHNGSHLLECCLSIRIRINYLGWGCRVKASGVNCSLKCGLVILWGKVMGLERGPLSLVSTTVELLDRKVAAPV